MAHAASRKFDLMHTPEPGELELYGYGARRNIVTLYDMATRFCAYAYDAHGIGIWERYFNFAVQRCACVVAISESTKRDVVEQLGIPEDRVHVTPLAARTTTRRMQDGEERRAILKALDLSDRPFVLYSGTLEPRKNLERLVKAFASAVQEGHLTEHKLVLAGGNWYRLDIELRLLALELGIGGRVMTPGYVTNQQMNALMSACDVFAYVSRYEGFGMPPLEAMVCGAPIVTSNTSSLPEVVGNAGIQVSPDDVQGIAGALFRLLTDREENTRRRALSREQARHFSWDKTAALTLQAYEAAVS
jgi:glycosyltransferase involved in cell wall biosynthesis